MSPFHHIAPEMLLDYVTGTMREPMAVLVASHASLCAHCAKQIAHLEEVGGELFTSLKSETLEPEILKSLMAKIDEESDDVPPPDEDVKVSAANSNIPGPLRAYLPEGLNDINWVRRSEGIEQARILEEFKEFDTRLFRLAPGVKVPRHTHEGEEATLVLTGGFSDGDRHFGRGDVAIADRRVTHMPIADQGEPCVSLAVATGSLRVPGLIGQLVKPFFRL